MTKKTLAIRLATGLAGSVALLGTLAAPAFAYNNSAYCSNRYSSSCIEQNWGTGYFQPYNTNYNSWYQNSSDYPYDNYSYSYPSYNNSYSNQYQSQNQYQYQYTQPYSYNSGYSSTMPMYYSNSYSTPSYSYQYQYQYQYQYHY